MFTLPFDAIGRLYSVIVAVPGHILYYCSEGSLSSRLIFNDRFYLSLFVAMRGFRERGFDFY